MAASAPQNARRPTAAELEAATHKILPDVLRADLRVVFCGINPSLYSAATGHHFARPGNRFWPALWRSGFTPRLLTPAEGAHLPDFGCGLTNVVARATARADEITRDEIRRGGDLLAQKLQRLRPRVVAFLGLGAYRTAFAAPDAAVGPQRPIGATAVWALPNPSGLNAHYQLDDFARLFGDLRRAAEDAHR
ncbi:MAG: G/U mismatch-specific DNA glycosylase [Planctomycetota bacterium]